MHRAYQPPHGSREVEVTRVTPVLHPPKRRSFPFGAALLLAEERKKRCRVVGKRGRDGWKIGGREASMKNRPPWRIR